MNNLDLWNRVKHTDEKHTKKANVKGNKITSIRPQSQILEATKEFGKYGETWGFKSLELDYTLSNIGLVSFHGVFYYPGGEFPIINSISLYRDNAQTKIDDEFVKKIETDAFTKALSKLGFNADIFLGEWDGNRYESEQPKSKTKLTDLNKAIEFVKKNGKKGLEQIKSTKDLTPEQLKILEDEERNNS